jgi:hypothetical protein
MTRHTWRATVCLVPVFVPLAAAWWVWRPLLDNYFFNDDFFHLYDLVTSGVARFVTQVWAGHLYLVRNTVFVGMFRAFGPDPHPYFWSVLMTHLLNVLLLYDVIRRLTGDGVIACGGAVLWGTSPVLEGTLGWYAVYGQVLLTAFVLVVLVQLAGTMASGRVLSPWRTLGWAMLLVVGGGCFGTGLGIAAVFPLVTVIALPAGQRPVRAVGVLAAAGALLLVVYALLRAHTQEPGAPTRDLLGVGSILRDLPEVVALTSHLLVFGSCTLLLGFLGLDTDYPSWIAGCAAGGVAVVLVAAWRTSDAAHRRQLATLGLLTLAAYGTVAAGRATIIDFFRLPVTSSAAWPRYHYLPLALLSILLCTGLSALRARSRIAGRTVYAVAALWTVARITLVVARPYPIDHHDTARVDTERVLRSVHDAVAATPPGGTAVIENQRFAPFSLPGTLPGWAGVFVVFFPDNTVDGRPVRFVVGETDWQLARARGGRIAGLVERR